MYESFIYASLAVLFCYLFASREQLGHIPTVGPSAPILSYVGAFRFLFNAKDLMDYGYQKYKLAPFKIAYIRRWVVVVSSPQHIKDIAQAPEEQLSVDDALQEITYPKYTMGSSLYINPYHVSIIQTKLTRTVTDFIPSLREEIMTVLDDLIPPQENGWVNIPAHLTVLRTVNTAISRVLVGYPLCRNADWLDLSLNYAAEVMKCAALISIFPNFLHPIVGPLVTVMPHFGAVDRGMKHLGPIIEERQALLRQHGKENAELPDDMLTWLILEGHESSVRALTIRILALNFAAIHTTSMSCSRALADLAAEPEKYLPPLREEVEAVLKQGGWTKNVLTKLKKTDSFLRESARLESGGALRMIRNARIPFTFSDGTYVPPGTFVAAASRSMNRDPLRYHDPLKFDGFRFLQSEEEPGAAQASLLASSPDWLHWGHGRRVCPGRYFATVVLKLVFTHMFEAFDFKHTTDGAPFRIIWIADSSFPDPKGQLAIRRHRT